MPDLDGALGPWTEDDQRALDHAWAWFQVHAGQRMQHVNFLLVSMALIVAGFGASVQAHRPGFAAVIAFAGCAIAICFWRLDVRTRELIRAGEAAIVALEERLSARVRLDELRLVATVETPVAPFSSYSAVIRALVAIFVVAFVTAGIYAVVAGGADGHAQRPSSHHQSTH